MVMVVEIGGARVRRSGTVSIFGWISFRIIGLGGSLLLMISFCYSDFIGGSYNSFCTFVVGGTAIGIVLSSSILIGTGFSISSNLGTTILLPFS